MAAFLSKIVLSIDFVSTSLINAAWITVLSNKPQIFIFSGLSLSRRSNSEKLNRLKIAADILTAFAGEYFTEEIEDTESL